VAAKRRTVGEGEGEQEAGLLASRQAPLSSEVQGTRVKWGLLAGKPPQEQGRNGESRQAWGQVADARGQGC